MRARWYRTAASATVLAFAMLFAGSAFGATITSFTPTSDWVPEEANSCVGSSITINGTGFVNDGGTAVVRFNGTPAVGVFIGSDRIIYARAPAGTTPGKVTVTTNAGTAESTASFTITPCASHAGPTILEAPAKATPKIASFTPSSGKTGAKVTVKGSNFTGVTSVKFGSVAAKFAVNSPTSITATVPAAAKTGKITVKSAAGSAVSTGTFTKK